MTVEDEVAEQLAVDEAEQQRRDENARLDELEAAEEQAAAELADAQEEAEAEEAAPPVVEEEPPPPITDEVLQSMIEALALASIEPLTPAKVREVLLGEEQDVPMTDIKQAFSTLMAKWSQPDRPLGHGFRLMEIDGGLVYRTTAVNARWIRRMMAGKPARLSRASLETLSVIAYRQPVTKPQIEEIRGVDCGGAVKALLDRKLIRILGKAEDVGRPLLYGTTRQFLDFFGLSSLTELPTLKQLHELEHGTLPDQTITPEELQRAVVMDLFNPDRADNLVSKETEAESNEALEALEKALGDAKDVAKKASALVFGLKDTEDDPAPATHAPVDDAPVPDEPVAAAPGIDDEEPN